VPVDPGSLDRTHSTSFDLLNEAVRRWIWSKNWDGLRDIQEAAIPHILRGERDLIISASTASGKTEAAFLPIVSRLADDGHKAGDGFSALYAAPLKALLNDQWMRMESLCEDADIPVVKWHGDAPQGKKTAALKKPGGILLITPESLEAMLIHRGPEISRLFAALKYIVIDEMHVFLDVARGRQLLSVINRIETAAGARTSRIGLSATLADVEVSKQFLRPLQPERVDVLSSSAASAQLMLQVRGYISEPWPPHQPPGAGKDRSLWIDPADAAIHRDLFTLLRGGRHLIFAGSRIRVETVADALSGLSEAQNLPQEFFPHHGNLAKEFREESEARMKDASRPASIVCTTTLELGIDVGGVETVAQLGPGHTVSGMRQRLGRTGRRPGTASIMRLFVKETDLSEADNPVDALRLETVQTIAMVNLMLQRWNEPPAEGRLNMSTMLHQVLALIGQGGGISPAKAWSLLGQSGIFPLVTPVMFKELLRQMGSQGLIEQATDGTLLPGPEGERLFQSREMYSVFMSPEEIKVITDEGRPIGTIPNDNPIVKGQYLLLGGRRWQVVGIYPAQHEVVVTHARGGIPPKFGGAKKPPADGVVNEMRRVYADLAVPIFLDHAAKEFLQEARESYDRYGLRSRSVIRHAESLIIFPWVGEKKFNALLLSFSAAKLEPTALGLALSVPRRHEAALRATLEALTRREHSPGVELAALVEEKCIEKFDHYLSESQLNEAYASEFIDLESVGGLSAQILDRWPEHYS
jgi:ATP-dependent Lhr-like helicase